MYVEIMRIVDAPIDRLWALLGDFANEGAATGLVETKGEGFGIGATCTSRVEGLTIRELCVNYDPEKFTVGYVVDTDAAAPVYDYVGTARLHFVDVNRTRIHWFSHWRWRGSPDHDLPIAEYERLMKQAYLTVIENMVLAIQSGR